MGTNVLTIDLRLSFEIGTMYFEFQISFTICPTQLEHSETKIFEQSMFYCYLRPRRYLCNFFLDFSINVSQVPGRGLQVERCTPSSMTTKRQAIYDQDAIKRGEGKNLIWTLCTNALVSSNVATIQLYDRSATRRNSYTANFKTLQPTK